MKVTVDVSVNVEATPEELRSFLGLPNIEQLQTEVLKAVRKNMEKGEPGFDVASLMKLFVVDQMKTFSNLQEALRQVTEKKPK